MEHRAVDFSLNTIEAALRGISLGGLRVFRSLPSTNDEALAWATAGANDMSLVVADQQTAGRGRSGRKWSTPAGTALALSLVLRGGEAGGALSGRLAGLAALAVAEACEMLGLRAEIKWPNDVLLQGRKVAGVLVEASWLGNVLDAAVVGVGVNVLSKSVPPDDEVRYPATSIEACLQQGPNRLEVLRLIIGSVRDWRERTHTTEFHRAWEDRLAFRGRQVVLSVEGAESIRGELDGIEPDGSLRLITSIGTQRLPIGELHLAAADDTIS